MKSIYSILTLTLIMSIIIPNAFAQTKESKLVFKATFKGGYSNFDDTTDSNYYFLVETKLINNTDSICEFVTMSCASLISIVKDSKQINFLYHNCASNYRTIIRLKPREVFSIPFILYRKKNIEGFKSEVKFGFVLVGTKSLQENSIEKLAEMNEKQQNVIWSEPITLNTCSFHPYEILREINDSTFTDVDYYRIKKKREK